MLLGLMGNCCLNSSHQKSPAGAGVWKAVLKSRSENLTCGLLCCPLQKEGGYIPEEGDHSAQQEELNSWLELQEGLLFMWRKNKINREISAVVVVARVNSDSQGYKAAMVWRREKAGLSSNAQQTCGLALYYCPRNIPGSV